MTSYLANYAYFMSKQEMEKAVQQHINKNINNLNDTDYKVLMTLCTYAEKYGAAHIKHATIERAIGKSNATVRRSLRKLESLNIIERTHYVRPVMNGLGANIYAIKPLYLNVDFKLNNITNIMHPSQLTIFDYL